MSMLKNLTVIDNKDNQLAKLKINAEKRIADLTYELVLTNCVSGINQMVTKLFLLLVFYYISYLHIVTNYHFYHILYF